MASKASASASASSKAKAKQVVAVKDGKIEVTDQAEASRQKVAALPDWLIQGPVVAAAYVEEEVKGLSTGAAAVIRDLAVAVSALRDRVEQLD